METSAFQTPVAGPDIERHMAVSPALSADSLRGALFWVVVTLVTAVLGGLASSQAAQFYGALRLPEWAPPASVFGLALVPNALWSWLFFDWHLGLWALLDIAVLWLLVGLTVRAFWKIRPAFALLMVPLWAWVSFAGVLNAVLWQKNPALLG